MSNWLGVANFHFLSLPIFFPTETRAPHGLRLCSFPLAALGAWAAWVETTLPRPRGGGDSPVAAALGGLNWWVLDGMVGADPRFEAYARWWALQRRGAPGTPSMMGLGGARLLVHGQRVHAGARVRLQKIDASRWKI